MSDEFPYAMPAPPPAAPVRHTQVGCGAAILRDGKLLLVQRRLAPEAGHWGLPGGKVEWAEPVADAVVREVREEVSLRLRDLHLLCVIDQIDHVQNEHWVAPTYTCTEFDGEPHIAEPSKHSGLGWYSLEALPHPLTWATKVAVMWLKAR
jgi:ADP-ribose pyrophosphatase YjhB (NUDIX family)